MGSDMTIRKKVPHLRSIAQPERSNAVKARGSWQVLGIISEFVVWWIACISINFY
jgi:hypothetical protein